MELSASNSAPTSSGLLALQYLISFQVETFDVPPLRLQIDPEVHKLNLQAQAQASQNSTPVTPEMEFLDINLAKDLSLLLHAINSPFYLLILKKTILYSDFVILTKNPRNKKTQVFS
jgi:hypothetical protein